MKVEVSKEEEGVIDWSKPQLVISEGGAVVMVVQDQQDVNYDEFNGVVMCNGNYLKGWNKRAFKPFTGVVTIKND